MSTKRTLPEALKARPDLRTQEGVRGLLEHVTEAMLAGAITTSQANSAAQLAGVSLRLIEVALDVQELELARAEAQRKLGPRLLRREDVIEAERAEVPNG